MNKIILLLIILISTSCSTIYKDKVVNGITYNQIIALEEDLKNNPEKEEIRYRIYQWKVLAMQQFYGPLQPTIDWDYSGFKEYEYYYAIQKLGYVVPVIREDSK